MFIWNRNTKIMNPIETKSVQNGVNILLRDMDKVFAETEDDGGCIRLVYQESVNQEAMYQKPVHQENIDESFSSAKSANETALDRATFGAECYRLEVSDREIRILAAGDLGFVYGLLYLSEHYLGIKPFWFWMDQVIGRKSSVEIPVGCIVSEKPAVRFRGWFYNDEVLMMKWKYNENGVDGWKMALEALLRCGGNMAIPGTDKMSRQNRQMATDMGLWITHHHAEPLGAELFARAFPGAEANYRQYPEKFEQLWEEAVVAQKDAKVVWNVCFRGQGDAPFWSSDTTGEFDTPKKRGRLISDLIKKQCDIVRKYVENPVFCTNLYGEIMELYMQGHMELDDAIIKIRADNGFGRMVSRRQGLHNPRVDAMPDKKEKGMQGIYYHVSFYDLQAANHITMLPNSIAFVDRELNRVRENGGDDFWVINCSNVRPHTYYLDAVRKKWFGRNIQDARQAKEFAEDYFGGNVQAAACYEAYPQAMIPYGEYEDAHAGEQFYTENVRLIANQFLADRTRPAEGLRWFADQGTLAAQTAHFGRICEAGLKKLEGLQEQCECTEKLLADARLFRSTLGLQAGLHCCGARGVVLFSRAFQAYEKGQMKEAFVLFGMSAECFDRADALMRAAEYAPWQDFYYNDCFADMKHTAYMVRKVRGVIRELGDSPAHHRWYRDYCYSPEDRNVYLLFVLDNHLTDEELYQVMKPHYEYLVAIS